MKSLYQAMLQERTDLRVEGNTILDNEERTAEEQARLDEITAKVAELNGSIEAEEQAREALRAMPAPAVLKHGRGDNAMAAAAHYLRTGDAGGLSLQAAYNNTDMNIGTPADGGYAVPTPLYNQIIVRRDESMIRDSLGLTPIPGVGLTVRVPIDAEGDVLFTSVAEAQGIDQDAPALYFKDFTLVKYAKYLTLSWELLRDEDAALLNFVSNWIGRGVAATNNKALITEALASGTAALTLDAAAAIGAAEIPEFVGKLAPEYANGAQWVLNPTTVAYIQGLSGNPMYFAPAAGAYGGKPTLWGYPAVLSSYASATQASAKGLLFGNFQYMGYREATSLTMLRDPYTAAGTGQIKLWFWFDVVYGVLQAEAINYATHPSA